MLRLMQDVYRSTEQVVTSDTIRLIAEDAVNMSSIFNDVINLRRREANKNT